MSFILNYCNGKQLDDGYVNNDDLDDVNNDDVIINIDNDNDVSPPLIDNVESIASILDVRQNLTSDKSDSNNIDIDKDKNKIITQYLSDLYEETMFKKNDMASNVSVLFDHTNGHLIVEYIGYKGTDFLNGQYFIKFELPQNYPDSPPKISVMTESGRFRENTHLSLSISHYHRESWYPMSLVFLVINMLSAFPDKTINGIGHMRDYTSSTIKELAEKSRSYNELHYPELCKSFKNINELKLSGSDSDIRSFIHKMIEY